MMLANALLYHLKTIIFNSAVNKEHYGLDISHIPETEVYESLEKEVLAKFMDSSWGKDSPFSIREITDQGLEWFHKVAGDWYGTNSISQVLKELNSKYKPFEDFEIWVFNDGIFFKSEVIKLGSELYLENSSISSNIDVATSDTELSLNESYFNQTRQGNNQSGGSDNKPEKTEEWKSEHSGGSDSRSKPKERVNMGSWAFNNEDVFEYNNKKRKWKRSVLVIINTRLGLK